MHKIIEIPDKRNLSIKRQSINRFYLKIIIKINKLLFLIITVIVRVVVNQAGTAFIK